MPAQHYPARQSPAFLSRHPVAHAEWHRPRFSRHAFIEVAPAGAAIRLFGLHVSAVHAAWTERRRVFELRSLLRSIAEYRVASTCSQATSTRWRRARTSTSNGCRRGYGRSSGSAEAESGGGRFASASSRSEEHT